MATRQERIDTFTYKGVPPPDQPLELLCEDHVGTYVIPFCADGAAVLGTVRIAAAQSKRGSSAGASVEDAAESAELRRAVQD